MWIRVGAIALVLAACKYTVPEDQGVADSAADSPVDLPLFPDALPDTPPRPYVGFDDATVGGHAGFYLFAPHGTSTDADPFTGPFVDYGTARVKASVVNIDCNPAGPTEGTLVATVNAVVVGAAGVRKYQAAKNVGTLGFVEGDCFRVKPTLDGNVLGFTDFQVSNQPPPAPLHRATPGSNLTVRFRTEATAEE
jgi:hypothetical protein